MKSLFKLMVNLQTSRLSLWLLGGGRTEGKASQGVWDGHVHTVFKIGNQKQGCAVQHVESAPCCLAAWTGRWFGKEWMHVYI